MRPAGEIHRAVLAAAGAVAAERAQADVPAATWLDVVERLEPQGFGRKAVYDTWHNLRKRGQLRTVGPIRLPHSCRPMKACVPAQLPASRSFDAGAALQTMLRGWAVRV